MPSESLFEPIPKELIRSARARLALAGDSVEDWATREGYGVKLVYQVLSGSRMCIRGRSLQIAIKLGLRPHPDSILSPAGRTLAESGPAASCGRADRLQLGEAVR